MTSRKPTKAYGFNGCLLVAAYCILAAAADANEQPNRRRFPSGFIFGTASSSYQIKPLLCKFGFQYEGAAGEGGRAPSIWDTFSYTPGKIEDGSNGNVAVDEYHHYKEDVQLMKNMGMDAYRFSISWSRVLPKGSLKGGINKEGVAYYNNLINELLKNGIKPFVTLFHWDLPQALEDEYGGFLSPNIVYDPFMAENFLILMDNWGSNGKLARDTIPFVFCREDFAVYAEVCFREFGDRVKHWITLNEPLSYAAGGYDMGISAPGRCSKYIGNCSAGNSATEPYIVGHNLLLSHAAAVDTYREKYQAVQKGSIGITIVTNWILPYSKTMYDQRAAQRAIAFLFGWFMDPITWGDYPSTMRSLVGARLPKFSKPQSRLLKGSFDFIGLNYYTSQYAIHNPKPPNPLETDYLQDSRVNLTSEKNGVPIGPRGASDWLYVYPPGIRDLLKYTKNRYNNPPIFITENGIDEFNNDTLSLKESLNDTWRIDYYAKHLSNVREAIRHGSDVRGFFAWSLLDNFEWINGYTVRFGLHYVDYRNNLNRYPKASARWFGSFLHG
eukprot:Gb_35945 [translate_table: standard]